MTKLQEMKRNLDNAKEHVAKVGRAEAHFRPTKYGKVSSLEVKTTICHQEYPSATNYWDDKAFDFALGQVVLGQWNELSSAAIGLLESQYALARIAEKDALKQQLAEIEQLELSQAAQ